MARASGFCIDDLMLRQYPLNRIYAVRELLSQSFNLLLSLDFPRQKKKETPPVSLKWI
jgi:hypothetical protein